MKQYTLFFKSRTGRMMQLFIDAEDRAWLGASHGFAHPLIFTKRLDVVNALRQIKAKNKSHAAFETGEIVASLFEVSAVGKLIT